MSFGLLFLALQDEGRQPSAENTAVLYRTPRTVVPDPFMRLSENAFVKHYRLTKSLAKVLITQLTPHMRSKRRSDGLNIETKVLAAVSFLATGSYQTLVGESQYHQISQPSMSRALHEVINALNAIFPMHVYFPLTRQARENIKLSFYQKFRIPGVIGCIDGSHVAIIRPKDNEERYFNRKGDSGYSLRRIMMTPIINAEPNTPAYHYYQAQVSARNTVERCIGVLKARFRCLLVARELH